MNTMNLWKIDHTRRWLAANCFGDYYYPHRP